MSQNKKFRIIHLRDMVASNASNLSLGERNLGYSSKCLYFKINKYSEANEADVKVSPYNYIRIFKQILNSDIIHFNNGRSLLPEFKYPNSNDSALKKILKVIFNIILRPFLFLDIKIIKLLGKKVFITYQGTDGRIGDFARNKFKIIHCHYYHDGPYSSYASNLKKYKVNKSIKLCNKIYSLNPDLLYNLGNNSSFLPYTSIDLKTWTNKNKFRSPNKIRVIAHAPTSSLLKGSKYILKAIKELEDAGYTFIFKRLEGVPHSEMYDFLNSVDLLIDQLLTGWYGGICVESMALGVPCMAYIRDEDLQFVDKNFKNDLPVIKTSIDSIKQDLISFLEMSDDDYISLSKRSYLFTHKYHSIENVAKQTTGDYKLSLS